MEEKKQGQGSENMPCSWIRGGRQQNTGKEDRTKKASRHPKGKKKRHVKATLNE